MCSGNADQRARKAQGQTQDQDHRNGSTQTGSRLRRLHAMLLLVVLFPQSVDQNLVTAAVIVSYRHGAKTQNTLSATKCNGGGALVNLSYCLTYYLLQIASLPHG